MNNYDQIARFYDIEHSGLKPDLLMYENFARRCGSPVLELGCGTGRVALHLARAGFEITGLDNSPVMLKIARQKLARAGLSEKARLLEADLADFALERRFALATLAVNTFMHFCSIADQLRVLTAARRHLEPGGLLVIDLPRATFLLLAKEGEPFTLNQTLTDPESGRTIFKMTIVEPDPSAQTQRLTLAYDETDATGIVRRTSASFRLYYFFPHEMELLLDKAGFIVEGIYGTYDLGPYEDEGERMIFVARSATI